MNWNNILDNFDKGLKIQCNSIEEAENFESEIDALDKPFETYIGVNNLLLILRR